MNLYFVLTVILSILLISPLSNSQEEQEEEEKPDPEPIIKEEPKLSFKPPFKNRVVPNWDFGGQTTILDKAIRLTEAGVQGAKGHIWCDFSTWSVPMHYWEIEVTVNISGTPKGGGADGLVLTDSAPCFSFFLFLIIVFFFILCYSKHTYRTQNAYSNQFRQYGTQKTEVTMDPSLDLRMTSELNEFILMSLY